ncbi:MAG: DUF4474 domain-containing protein [Lachnospiraceae bacterium]|nr:DUF4474 domain-containing protein [Lachnospiraceae bacterium]
MYVFFALFLLLLIIMLLINHWRKKRIIEKVCSMCPEEKYWLMNEIIEPFGYAYLPEQDIFSTRIDAWQREFGYRSFFDRAAPWFGMVFDSLPIYFDYGKTTWLLELWKGQYGINTGCEIGLYRADRLLKPSERKRAHFHSVSNAEMILMSFVHLKRDSKIAQLTGKHWWLTAFNMGCFSRPRDLTLHATLVFSSRDMAQAFVNGLLAAGYPADDLRIRYDTVTMSFTKPLQKKNIFSRMVAKISLWFCRLWCRIFLFVTRPFCLSLDKILYLYFYLPFAFRKTFRGIARGRKRRRS